MNILQSSLSKHLGGQKLGRLPKQSLTVGILTMSSEFFYSSLHARMLLIPYLCRASPRKKARIIRRKDEEASDVEQSKPKPRSPNKKPKSKPQIEDEDDVSADEVVQPPSPPADDEDLREAKYVFIISYSSQTSNTESLL